MTKAELKLLLDRSGSSITKLARDLGIAQSTASRWRDDVPGYAQWYARARLIMSEEQRQKMDDHQSGTEKAGNQRVQRRSQIGRTRKAG